MAENYEVLTISTAAEGASDWVSVAALPSGGFVAVWEDGGGKDGSAAGIYARLFDENYNRVGDEFLVNTLTSGFQTKANVAALSDGTFMVVWAGGDGSYQGQIFSSIGAKVGAQFAVGPWFISEADIIGSSDDTFLVLRSQTNEKSVLLSVYSKTGQILVQPVIITSNDGTEPRIIELSEGRYVAVWHESESAGGSNIKARIFDGSGNLHGSELSLTSNSGNERKASELVATGDGGFATVWQSYAEASQSFDISFRIFDQDGVAITHEQIINSTTIGEQAKPSIARADDGTFIVAWQSNHSGVSQILYQKIGSDGQLIGDNGSLSVASAGPLANENDVTLETLAGGAIIAAWDSDAGDISARVIEIPSEILVVREGEYFPQGYQSFKDAFVGHTEPGSLASLVVQSSAELALVDENVEFKVADLNGNGSVLVDGGAIYLSSDDRSDIAVGSSFHHVDSGDGQLLIRNEGIVSATGRETGLVVGDTDKGTLILESGGSLIQTSEDTSTIHIGRWGGIGDVVVTGSSSLIMDSSDDDTDIQVGLWGGTGSLSVQQSSKLTLSSGPTAAWIRIGDDLATGVMHTNNSDVSLEGRNSFVIVGDNSGDGELVIENSSTFNLTGRVEDGVEDFVNSRISVGENDATGSLSIKQSSVNLAAADTGIMVGNGGGLGTAEVLDQALVNLVGEYSFLSVGHYAGSGLLQLASGARVNLGKNPNPGSERTTSAEIKIGSSWWSQSLGGQGLLRVEGGETTLSAMASKVNVDIGRHGGSGTLEIMSGGQVLLTGLSTNESDETSGRTRISIGEGRGSKGLLKIDGEGSALSLSGHSTRIQVGESRESVEYKFFAFDAATSATGEATPVFKNSDLVRFYGDVGSGFEPVIDTLDQGSITPQTSVGLETRNLRDYFSYAGETYSLQHSDGIHLSRLTLENGVYLDIVEFRFLTEFPGEVNSIFAYAAPNALPHDELSAFLATYPLRSVPSDVVVGNFYSLSEVPGVQISNTRSGGDGALEVTNGASLDLTSSHQKMWDETERNHSEAQIKIGYYEGSKGVALFSGENTTVNLKGHSADIVVGHNNGGIGQLDILEGAHVTIASVYEAEFSGEWSGAQLQVGSRWTHQPTGGNGDVLIGGPDTRVEIDGHSARAVVGRGGGTGVLTVNDGARLDLSSTRQWDWVDEERNHSNAEILVGEGAGSIGRGDFSGIGTEINLRGHSTTIYVGQNDGAEGTLDIRDGVSVQLSSLFEAGHGDDWSGAQLQIGSRWSDRAEAGTGTVTVSGSTTTLGLSGHSSDIVVGHNGGDGTLTVSEGAKVNLTSGFQQGNTDEWSGSALTVGGSWSHQPLGGNGDVVVDGLNTTINLSGHNAYMQIGENGGAGVVDIRSGAQMTIASQHDELSLELGGRSSVSVGEGYGSTGTLKIDGADSKLSLTGHSARVQVGEARELVSYTLPAMSVIWAEQKGTFDSAGSITFFGDERAGFAPLLGEYSDEGQYLDIDTSYIKGVFEYNGITYSSRDIAQMEMTRAKFTDGQEVDLWELFFHQTGQEEKSIIVSLNRTTPLATSQQTLDSLTGSLIETVYPPQFEPGQFYLLSDFENIQTEEVRFGGVGALEVTSGAALELKSDHQHAWDEIARNHSEAQIKIGYHEGSDGKGVFSGVGTKVSLEGHAATIAVGHNNGAKGHLDILDGAYVKVKSIYEQEFGDRWSGADFFVGSRWSDQPKAGVGKVNIAGTDTVVELTGHSTTFAVGHNQGVGDLAILEGAHVKLVAVYDNALVDEWTVAAFHVGSRWDSQPSGGAGTAKISTSKINFDGHSTIFHIGNGGVGDVVVDGASTIDMKAVSTSSDYWSGSWLSVGRGDELLQLSGNGKLVVSGAETSVNLEGTQSYLTIGSRGGSGNVEILSGASLTLQSHRSEDFQNFASDNTNGRSIVGIGSAWTNQLTENDPSKLLVSGQNSILNVTAGTISSLGVGTNGNLVITDGGRVVVETTQVAAVDNSALYTPPDSTKGYLSVRGASINEISALTLNGGSVTADNAEFSRAWLVGHGIIDDVDRTNGFLELSDTRIMVGDVLAIDDVSDQIVPEYSVGRLEINGDAHFVRSEVRFDLGGSQADYLYIDGVVDFEDVTIHLVLNNPSLDSYRLMSARNDFEISELSSVYFDASLSLSEVGGGLLESRWNSAEQMYELWHVSEAPPVINPALDITLASKSGNVATFHVYATAAADSGEPGFQAFQFDLSHDVFDMAIDEDSFTSSFDPNTSWGLTENNGFKTLSFGGFSMEPITDLTKPLLTFDAMILNEETPFAIAIDHIITDITSQPPVEEEFDFSSVEISTTVTDRFGRALSDVSVSAYEYAGGGDDVWLWVREALSNDTSRVFEIVVKPSEAVSAIDFDLMDNVGMIDFQVGTALNGWSLETNTTTPSVVKFAGIGAVDGSQDLLAGQEVVLATFETSLDPDFVIDGIVLNQTIQSDISFGEVAPLSQTGNGTVHEVARGSYIYLDADKPIDKASDQAITAYDALQALRLAVNMKKSDGKAEWHDYIAADIDKNGMVTAYDALNILKFAVGRTDGPSADWVFVDGDADWSAIGRKNTIYEEGIWLENVVADMSVNMTGILVGDVNGSYNPSYVV